MEQCGGDIFVCRSDSRFSRQVARYERQLMQDQRRHSDQQAALLAQRRQIHRLSNIITRERKVRESRDHPRRHVIIHANEALTRRCSATGRLWGRARA